MTAREDYFARVRPILGSGLSEKTVAVGSLQLTGRVVELLAGCLLERVIVRERSGLEAFDRFMYWKNSFRRMQWLDDGAPDLTIDARLIPAGDNPRVVWRGALRQVTLYLVKDDPWSQLEISYAVARRARDVLLGREPWPDDVTYHGHRDWPFAQLERPGPAPQPAPPVEAGKHVMVIGCGSVGSEVIRWLSREPLRWTLVDSSRVSIFNPHRQWFGTDEVGQAKVDALARRLVPAQVRPVRAEIHADNLDRLAQLIDSDRPDAVLLATGTADHGPVAELLWRKGVPHVAACAYPQARFFEVMPVIPAEATPCLSCFRGNLYRGIESSAPMSDELAHFLYRELTPAERDRAYIDLVAEPATPIETGRIAEVAGRCLVELLAPAARRSQWFKRLLAEATSCLLGGSVVEPRGPGETAYGITFAGQVVRLGVDDVVGSGAALTCPVCGRTLEVKHRVELPAADEDAVDLALLQKVA